MPSRALVFPLLDQSAWTLFDFCSVFFKSNGPAAAKTSLESASGREPRDPLLGPAGTSDSQRNHSGRTTTSCSWRSPPLLSGKHMPRNGESWPRSAKSKRKEKTGSACFLERKDQLPTPCSCFAFFLCASPSSRPPRTCRRACSPAVLQPHRTYRREGRWRTGSRTHRRLRGSGEESAEEG